MWAPRSAAMPAVRSVEPSSTTTISNPGSNARISSITRPTDASSFSAGTIASRFSSPSCASTSPVGGTRTSASSAMRGHRRRGTDQIQDLPGAVGVRVLVEHTLAGTTSHRLCRPGIVQQLTVGGDGLLCGGHDTQLGAGLEPALDALVWIGDDRRARGCELERATGRRCVHGRVGTARDVQVDPAAGDGLREHVEGDVADHARVADVAAEVPPAEGDVDLRLAPAPLPDEGPPPLPPQTVAGGR